MHFAKSSIWAVIFVLPLVFFSTAFAYETDDIVPEVTDRVARISFLSGDVKIRRGESTDWEAAVMNLPIVEGDELWTEANGRFEIQFNSGTHVRVSENANLKITGLSDSGIALSLPQGNLTVRTREFDPDKSFVEIDAPKTTVSLRRAGMYRIDAGQPGADVLRIAATDGGEARVYTENSGFTVKSGRSARLFLAGSAAGEWAMADASSLSDEFDSWSLDRDAIVAERLRDAHYDKYYDRDIYGAEDLSDYGEWIHTSSYGYVWRPYSNATSAYDNWSPYRYGHWRWVPPYGWTWVNDEPWGWATYHYGRWVWDGGYWVWAPYGYYRNRRSWWRPALVVINVIRSNICWYPLDYYSGYYDYNRHYYRRRRGNNHGGWGGNQGGGNPTNPNPSPSPTPGTQVIIPEERKRGWKVPVPPGSVITVSKEQWGKTLLPGQKADQDTAKVILAKAPQIDTPPILPPIDEVKREPGSGGIRTVRPLAGVKATRVVTGAVDRKAELPMDTELRKTRIFGNRVPVERPASTDSSGEKPRTGAVGRPPIFAPRNDDEVKTEKPRQNDSPPIIAPRNDEDRKPARVPRQDTPPIFAPKSDEDRKPARVPREDSPPIIVPRNDEKPKQEERRRNEPTFNRPERREERPAPRYEPPPRNESPRSDPPKSSPPPPKSDPPPASNERPSPKKDG